MADAFLKPARFSDAEWQARVQLAACYRIFAHLGWAELIYNHISLRVPGPEHHFLINPFGLHYSEVRASNLVKVDVDAAPETARKFSVQAVPTLLILKDGRVLARQAGAAPSDVLLRWVDETLENQPASSAATT